jgi:predicted transcriptional regulator
MGTTQAVVARLESGKVFPSTRTLGEVRQGDENAAWN